MKAIFLIFTSLFSVLSFSQTKVEDPLVDKKMAEIPSELTNSIDSIAKYINANFKTENDKIRAVFYWTASNISYDVENMYVINFNETQQDRISKTLKTRKGICIDYANIFNDLANSIGVKSHIITGYTKTNDRVANLSHAWCAATIDNKWYLFDPTWAAGTVMVNKRTRKIINNFYKVEPELMIYSHMPFDYLWQFVNKPITNQEFIEGTIYEPEKKDYFDFTNEIIRYESLSKVNQSFESLQRIEKNGMKNHLISQAYIDATRQWNYEKDKESRIKFNEANSKVNEIVKQFRAAIDELNNFINYRNKQFQPLTTDIEIKRKIQEPIDVFVKCKKEISSIENIGDENKANLNELENTISKTLGQAKEHLQFVNLYLAKPKIERKAMFYSVVRSPKTK